MEKERRTLNLDTEQKESSSPQRKNLGLVESLPASKWELSPSHQTAPMGRLGEGEEKTQSAKQES